MPRKGKKGHPKPRETLLELTEPRQLGELVKKRDIESDIILQAIVSINTGERTHSFQWANFTIAIPVLIFYFYKWWLNQTQADPITSSDLYERALMGALMFGADRIYAELTKSTLPKEPSLKKMEVLIDQLLKSNTNTLLEQPLSRVEQLNTESTNLAFKNLSTLWKTIGYFGIFYIVILTTYYFSKGENTQNFNLERNLLVFFLTTLFYSLFWPDRRGRLLFLGKQTARELQDQLTQLTHQPWEIVEHEKLRVLQMNVLLSPQHEKQLAHTLKAYNFYLISTHPLFLVTRNSSLTEKELEQAQQLFLRRLECAQRAEQEGEALCSLLKKLTPEKASPSTWQVLYPNNKNQMPSFQITYASQNHQDAIARHIYKRLKPYFEQQITFVYGAIFIHAGPKDFEQLYSDAAKLADMIQAFCQQQESEEAEEIEFTEEPEAEFEPPPEAAEPPAFNVRKWLTAKLDRYSASMNFFRSAEGTKISAPIEPDSWQIKINKKTHTVKYNPTESTLFEQTEEVKFLFEEWGINYFGYLDKKQIPREELDLVEKAYEKGYVLHVPGAHGVVRASLEDDGCYFKIKTAYASRVKSCITYSTQGNALIFFYCYDPNPKDPKRRKLPKEPQESRPKPP